MGISSSSGNEVAVSAAGAMKTDGSAVTQPVSGTVTAAQATAANLNATVTGTVTANAGSGSFNTVPGAPTTTTLTSVSSARTTTGTAAMTFGVAVRHVAVSINVTADSGTTPTFQFQVKKADTNGNLVAVSSTGISTTTLTTAPYTIFLHVGDNNDSVKATWPAATNDACICTGPSDQVATTAWTLAWTLTGTSPSITFQWGAVGY
jgi:hypothetical protein